MNNKGVEIALGYKGDVVMIFILGPLLRLPVLKIHSRALLQERTSFPISQIQVVLFRQQANSLEL